MAAPAQFGHLFDIWTPAHNKFQISSTKYQIKHKSQKSMTETLKVRDFEFRSL